MTTEVISSDELKGKFKDKLNDIYKRLNLVIDNLDIGNNSSNFHDIYQSLLKIEENILTLENKLDENKINDIEERNRIIDQKILKLFMPFILYYKLCLITNYV
ncbi:hypothetical protein crov378 [Cafeteria roenbergensis virus]|uniref:Uncharacterized protein n=1 Tax=Cafeteria roenbergensis virus (strain BV-PW1) TaxID=693272 RepID=E3T5E9_CROVB|nr:hypothetical protein crov378 [Cafeteria roenbergensis virus BV-PW1]ADO67412.1 hypothetical protein crov378 [Cafeteria roenbergensis virus BV-PW1]